jgi:hypothetical protein
VKIYNNKPIEVTELNLKTYALYKDGETIAEQRDMYWVGPDGRLHGALVMGRLCPDGCSGVVPIAIATSSKAYLDDMTVSVNNVEDISRRIFLQPNEIYHIDITLIARMETVKIPTPYPFIKGTLVYQPPKITLRIESVEPHRPNHEI